MSERTTIGGVVYESLGSSTSNLLLKCNGTARIQWGNKLIDLIKNGKIASEGSQELLFVVKNESDITSDGVYLVTSEESSQLWISKDGIKYNFTDTDLYISATNQQQLTVEQQQQALNNIGIYYDTLEDVKAANIKNGIVYVLNTKTLYTIYNGIIEEFEAKIKTVTVDKEEKDGEIINSSVKIILSVLDQEYLILADQRITANYSIHVKNSAQIGSESADKHQGYRLYIDGDTSFLDVDEINVRNGIKNIEYIEITFSELKALIDSEKLEPRRWYLITDYQNHWKLPNPSTKHDRPILIRALDEASLYEDGFLFKDQSVSIKYDPNYIEQINTSSEVMITSRGRIIWMKDQYNNESNFDFLDYTDSDDNPLTILHEGSIFPKGSYNNKLFVENLKGTVIKNNIIDNTNTYTIEFGTSIKNMYDNFLQVKNLKVNCVDFYNNTLTDVYNLEITANCYNNTMNDVNNIQLTQIIRNCRIASLTNSTISATLTNCKFQEIKDCTFGEGSIENVTSYCDLNTISFSQSQHSLLYNSEKVKEIYNTSGKLNIISIPDVIFYRGMILMHSGIEPIPPGWAICDGKTYEYEGVKSKTPNLKNQFIKAVTSVAEIKQINNSDLNADNELTLLESHLPAHTHPHSLHSHTFQSTGYASFTDSFSAITKSEEVTAVQTIEGGEKGFSGDDVSSSTVNISGNATFNVSGTTSSVASIESEKTWENNPIKIEPNYYALIFIMKL